MTGATLKQMQRWATTDLRRLGVDLVAEVRWGGERGGDGLGGAVDPSCARMQTDAHAHCWGGDVADGVARICIRRGRGSRELIRHEVAHFAPGGNGHGDGHLRAMAALGSKGARRQRVAMGKARCPRHVWRDYVLIEEKVTARGLRVLYAARCARCGKEIGKRG